NVAELGEPTLATLMREVDAKVSTAVLHIARELLARGLSVIPVPRADGVRFNGKVPALCWREFQARLPTEAEVSDWFGSKPTNIGIVTGAISGLVVVDVDSPEAVSWWTKNRPYTPWQTRSARGYHLFYRHPGVRVGNVTHLETRDRR